MRRASPDIPPDSKSAPSISKSLFGRRFCHFSVLSLVLHLSVLFPVVNVFAQPAGGDNSIKPCGDWEKIAKDEITRFKQRDIETADKEAKLELQCVTKIHKLRSKKNAKLEAMKKEVSALQTSFDATQKELEKWKKRAKRAENVLRKHVETSELKRKKIKTEKADLEDQISTLKKRVSGWHAAASLVAKWAKEEHENRHKWMKNHADELGELSNILKKEKLKFSESYLTFIKKGFTKPEEFLHALKTLYADAKKKRSKREAVFSNHKEKEFQKSLKLLESEAPAGFLRGQGALAASPSSTSDPSALFGLQPTSSTADSDLTYKSLPGSRMSALGGNAGPSTNQWI